MPKNTNYYYASDELTCHYENSDEPSCPKCGHYNAMLYDAEAFDEWYREQGREQSPDFRKCRDCGAEARCVPRGHGLTRGNI